MVHEIYDLQNATKDQIKLLQEKSLEILLYFKDFCEKHDLTFYLCGGCCIGAVMHNGFVPWDDDIDVFMPRDDYERLNDLWHEYADTEKYTYCRTNKHVNYRTTDSSIRDNNTTFINSHSQHLDIHHGIALEVIPLDGCPSSKLERAKQIFFAMAYSLFNAQRLPDNQGKLIRFISKIILSLIRSPKLRYSIWSYSEEQMTKYKIDECEYITELVTGFRYMQNKYPKDIFQEPSYIEFEGHQMPVPTKYDTYLKMAFGDYMQLPPRKDRIPKHDTVYINLKESYKKFKGIYYCISQKGEGKNE